MVDRWTGPSSKIVGVLTAAGWRAVHGTWEAVDPGVAGSPSLYPALPSWPCGGVQKPRGCQELGSVAEEHTHLFQLHFVRLLGPEPLELLAADFVSPPQSPPTALSDGVLAAAATVGAARAYTIATCDHPTNTHTERRTHMLQPRQHGPARRRDVPVKDTVSGTLHRPHAWRLIGRIHCGRRGRHLTYACNAASCAGISWLESRHLTRPEGSTLRKSACSASSASMNARLALSVPRGSFRGSAVTFAPRGGRCCGVLLRGDRSSPFE